MASRRHSAPLKTPLTGRCFQRGRVLAIVGGSAFVHETKSLEAKETTRFSGALSGFDRPSPARPRARTVRPTHIIRLRKAAQKKMIVKWCRGDFWKNG
jgi:hypothetical protein